MTTRLQELKQRLLLVKETEDRTEAMRIELRARLATQLRHTQAALEAIVQTLNHYTHDEQSPVVDALFKAFHALIDVRNLLREAMARLEVRQ